MRHILSARYDRVGHRQVAVEVEGNESGRRTRREDEERKDSRETKKRRAKGTTEQGG